MARVIILLPMALAGVGVLYQHPLVPVLVFAKEITKAAPTPTVRPIAETFMPGIISTDSLEFNTCFSPNGNAFYFTRSLNKKTRIFTSVKKGSSWSAPGPASFSHSAWSDADPAFSPTGELYFISNRPRNTSDTTKDYDIWKVTALTGNQWSEPVNVTELNSAKDEFYISFTRNGDACFSSSREGGYGEEDIYYCERKGNAFGNARNLGQKVNTPHAEYDPFITTDGSGLIFTSSGRKDSFGKADLYWSVKTNTSWAPAQHFAEDINTPTRDFCPYITADLKYFFYSSQGEIKFLLTTYLPDALQLHMK